MLANLKGFAHTSIQIGFVQTIVTIIQTNHHSDGVFIIIIVLLCTNSMVQTIAVLVMSMPQLVLSVIGTYT